MVLNLRGALDGLNWGLRDVLRRKSRNLVLRWCNWFWYESPGEFGLLLKITLVLLLVVPTILAADRALSVDLVDQRGILID